MRKFKPSAKDVGQRADIIIAQKYPAYSRSALNRLFDNGSVLIGDAPAKSSHRLKAGEQIKLDDSLLKLKAEPIELPVIYEDDDVVVMDKPAGVLSHTKGALNDEATVASFLHGKITDKELSGNREGIVHRLDRATSGLIIGAKTKAAQDYLQKQFSKRKVKKTYVAVVEGWPNPPEALIDAPIERNPRMPQTFRVSADGKSAQTHYKTLKQLQNGAKKYALLELKPTTGRTHQLRVHLKYINHPIVGDRLYGSGDDLLLHASELEITLPGGNRQVFTSTIPERIREFGAK